MTVIDHPEQVERLMERLGTALPIPARLTPEVQITLRRQRGVIMPANCSVTWISYAGDEGGIPLAWLTDLLQRIVSGRTKNHQLHTLLSWNWRQPSTISATHLAPSQLLHADAVGS